MEKCITHLLVLILSLADVHCSKTYGKPQNCSAEAIEFSKAFIEKDCAHFPTAECLEIYRECESGYGIEIQPAIDACAKELNMPIIKNTAAMICLICDTENYNRSLQIKCCLKMKLAEIHTIPIADARKANDKCIKKLKQSPKCQKKVNPCPFCAKEPEKCDI